MNENVQYVAGFSVRLKKIKRSLRGVFSKKRIYYMYENRFYRRRHRRARHAQYRPYQQPARHGASLLLRLRRHGKNSDNPQHRRRIRPHQSGKIQTQSFPVQPSLALQTCRQRLKNEKTSVRRLSRRRFRQGRLRFPTRRPRRKKTIHPRRPARKRHHHRSGKQTLCPPCVRPVVLF